MPSKTTKSTPPATTVKGPAKPKSAAKASSTKTAAAADAKKTAAKASAGSPHPLEGKPAPAFTLAAQNGATLSLKDLTARGNLVLYFYPKDLTPGCTTEACDFRDNISELREAGAEVVGVSGDSSALHDRFIAKHGLNFPLLSDPDNKVAKAYGVYKMKSLYGRQFMGIERTTFIIDRKGVIRHVFPKVKVNGHANAVLSALQSLS
ncbi:MAG TPA: thioredoxin-dependent thiol peroxidase [Candidatus Binataceae bacterium]|nr:thioredoxin-dependent thiol peroxidase [Candidatus Binataceae bacterium]